MGERRTCRAGRSWAFDGFVRNPKPNSLSVLAHAYYRKGDLPKAIATAEQAVAAATANPETDPHSLTFMKRKLESYRAAAAK